MRIMCRMLAAAIFVAIFVFKGTAFAQLSCTGLAVGQTCTNTGSDPNASMNAFGTVNSGVFVPWQNGIATWTQGGGNASMNNLGTINSGTTGVFDKGLATWTQAGGNATFNNYGTVNSTNSGSNSDGIATWAEAAGNATMSNFGTINSTNSGNDSKGIDTWTWAGDGNATMNNYGTVNSVNSGDNSNGISTSASDGNATMNNFGTVNSATSGNNSNAIDTWAGGGNATMNNSGTINGVIATWTWGGGNTTMNNSGTVNGTIVTGVFSGGNVMTNNSGTVHGNIDMYGWSGGNSTLVNSGTVSNPGQTAIEFETGNAAFVILPGSFIVGDIQFGGASNTVTVRERNLDFTFNSLAETTVTGTVPYVVSGNRIASVDPTNFGLTDRTLMDFTYALLLRVREAQTNEPGGLQDGNAASLTGVNGLTAWATGFYGERVQQVQGIALGSHSNFSGGAFGLNRAVLPGLRLGVFAGGGSFDDAIDVNAGSAKSDIAFGGLHSRYAAGAVFLDAALIGGALRNNTSRNVNNNMTADGLETAKTSFAGWFVEPAVVLGYRYAFLDGWSLTPALKVRYLGAGHGGYTETGSAANLTVSGRVLQDLEERAEFALSRIFRLENETELRVGTHGGVLGLERTGGTAIDGTLLGQNISFAAPGKDHVTGAYGGLDLDFSIGGNLSLFASGEYTATNDSATLVTANGGVHWQW